jgi:CDP-glycerol glycerophosphotransferase
VVNVVILAAGMGTRLGRPHPKSLTPLTGGRSIQRQQLDHIRATFGDGAYVTIVVGFKKELIMEASGDQATFVYNELYDQTNTSKSLLKALRLSPPGGVLWMNGDVVFVPGLLDLFTGAIAADRNFVAVNTASVADEEVKYTLDEHGHIDELSKKVVGGLGEAVGINYVSAADKATLIEHLAIVDDQDYFEGGIESAIRNAGIQFVPIDISAYGCVEVDFEPDLERANELDFTEPGAAGAKA